MRMNDRDGWLWLVPGTVIFIVALASIVLTGNWDLFWMPPPSDVNW